MSGDLRAENSTGADGRGQLSLAVVEPCTPDSGRICAMCGERFEPYRTWDRFCCEKCRWAWHKLARNEGQRLLLRRRTPIEERFQEFHETNPHVYEQLRNLALRLKRRGRTRYGMKGLFEVLRWQHAMETDDPEFKLNNNYTAHYARLLMEREPELAGFFEIRKSRG